MIREKSLMGKMLEGSAGSGTGRLPGIGRANGAAESTHPNPRTWALAASMSSLIRGPVGVGPR
jgi:hypothetical protein